MLYSRSYCQVDHFPHCFLILSCECIFSSICAPGHRASGSRHTINWSLLTAAIINLDSKLHIAQLILPSLYEIFFFFFWPQRNPRWRLSFLITSLDWQVAIFISPSLIKMSIWGALVLCRGLRTIALVTGAQCQVSCPCTSTNHSLHTLEALSHHPSPTLGWPESSTCLRTLVFTLLLISGI